MIKVPPYKYRLIFALAGVAEPVTTMVTVPKPAVVDSEGVLVTVTFPILDCPQLHPENEKVQKHSGKLSAAAGAALLFAK